MYSRCRKMGMGGNGNDSMGVGREIMYQVVGFGWGDGRHSDGRRQSVV